MIAVPSSGKVASVRCAVVDVAFDDQALPPINSAFAAQWGQAEPLFLDLHSNVAA